MPSPGVEATILARGLTKRYEDFTAVDRLDLEVAAGEIFGLLGPNGAGKTTTILMLLGLSEPSEGEARVMGLDPTRHPLQVKRVLGYVPDNVGFYPDLTGRQNLGYTAKLNLIPEPEATRRIESLLERVGLASAADSPVGTYSRGMRQRLGIADALVKEPKVLILDEPTVGIDPQGVRDILDLIESLSHQHGMTVLLSSHLLHQVQAICNRVGIFVKARLVAVGPVAELAARLAGDEVTVEIQVADWERAGEVLGGIEGVRGIEREDQFWVVTAERDIRPELVRSFEQRDISLLHLRRREESLDEIYARYFREGESDGET
ncbi:MAG: ATP-binding cassette domain-containing protein [Actinomycetota bacterium]